MLLSFQAFLLSAQNSYILQNKAFDDLTTFDILIDKNYTFEQIYNNKTKPFVSYSGKYDFKGIDYCWLRFIIKNPSTYTKYAYLSVVPALHNVLYSYNTDTKSWQTLHTGMEVNTERRKNDVMPCVFRANSQDTFFLKVKVQQLAQQPYKVGFKIKIEQEKYYLEHEQFMLLLWGATLLTILVFFFYNLYIYFIFKDTTYLYYLITLLGGIIYITANHTYFNILLSARLFHTEVNSYGNIYFFDLNAGFARMGVAIIMTGFVQFARTYLQLSWQFIFWNTVLKYMLVSCLKMLYDCQGLRPLPTYFKPLAMVEDLDNRCKRYNNS